MYEATTQTTREAGVSSPSLKPKAVSLKQIAENTRSGHLYKLIHFVPKQQSHPAWRLTPQTARPEDRSRFRDRNPSRARPAAR